MHLVTISDDASSLYAVNIPLLGEEQFQITKEGKKKKKNFTASL